MHVLEVDSDLQRSISVMSFFASPQVLPHQETWGPFATPQRQALLGRPGGRSGRCMPGFQTIQGRQTQRWTRRLSASWMISTRSYGHCPASGGAPSLFRPLGRSVLPRRWNRGNMLPPPQRRSRMMVSESGSPLIVTGASSGSSSSISRAGSGSEVMRPMLNRC